MSNYNLVEIFMYFLAGQKKKGNIPTIQTIPPSFGFFVSPSRNVDQATSWPTPTLPLEKKKNYTNIIKKKNKLCEAKDKKLFVTSSILS